MAEEKNLREEMKYIKGEMQTLKQQVHNMSTAKSTNIKVNEMNVKCLKITV